MLTPANSGRSFRFCVLAGVEDVRIERKEIVGRFHAEVTEFYGPRNHRLIEDFLNWPHDIESVLRFTRKYGPLKDSPDAGKPFAVSWFPWSADQTRFQNLWRNRNILRSTDWQPSGGSLAFRDGWLTFTTANLYEFLYLDLVTCEAKRLKICKRPGCPHPYFIARHLKQRFCDERCAEWGQREWKKQWWDKHGDSWRARRRLRENQQKGGSRWRS